MFFEEILNFFLQNIFFFIILLFGLSRLFQRTVSSSGEEGKKSAPNPLPPVVKPFFDEKVEPLDEQKVKTALEQIETNEKIEEAPTIELAAIEAEPAANTYLQVEKSTEKSEQKVPDFYPSKNELRNAVIWSEILGPPRAYKKHMQRR